MKNKQGHEKLVKVFGEEVLSGMMEWREGHPKATFIEIEREMEERIAVLRGKMLEEIIRMSSTADWGEGEKVQCPECGGEVKREGKHKRQLQGSGGTEIEIEREYAKCPACGTGFFPSG